MEKITDRHVYSRYYSPFVYCGNSLENMFEYEGLLFFDDHFFILITCVWLNSDIVKAKLQGDLQLVTFPIKVIQIFQIFLKSYLLGLWTQSARNLEKKDAYDIIEWLECWLKKSKSWHGHI